jgi:flavodoxin
MNAIVAYHSRTGNTRRAAETIAARLKTHGDDASVVPIEQLTTADVEAADVIFLGTWAQGLFVIRVRPAGIERWLPTLPALAGKPVGLFATYRLRPAGLLRKFADAVRAKGGRVVAADAFRPGDQVGIEAFVQKVLNGRTA